jgi:ribosome-binding factor A
MKKTRRTSKVGDLIRDTLADLIRRDETIQREIGQPAGMLVGVTGVEVAPDLQFAKVHISTLGDEAEIDRVVEILKKHRGRLRAELGRRVSLRYTPQLDLRPDRTSLKASAIEELIREAAERDAEIPKDE